MRPFASTLIALSLLACGGSGFRYDPENPLTFKPIIEGGFNYVAGGYGFDANDDLVLIGQGPAAGPDVLGETVRWSRDRKEFERFGGPIAPTHGRVFRDGKGRLYLHSDMDLLTWAEGEAAWAPVPLPLSTLETSSEQRFALEQVDVDRSGTLFAAFRYISKHEPGVMDHSGFALLRRSAGEAAFSSVLELPYDQQGFVTLNGERLSAPTLHARGDGTLFVSFTQALFALPPGGETLVRVFDCTAVVGRYCDTAKPVTHPLSDEAFIPGYRLPAGTSFPMVPEALDEPGSLTELRLGSDGTLWSSYTEKDALALEYPPYIADRTTVRRLRGTAWEPVVAFQTPGFTWVQADHDAFYSFGRQLIAGGIWTSWGVYVLEPQ